jgi:Rne/Rng family ribonuclease
MNKELFVSSTPHETKVGLVEDDLLAEVYLERENEYTLAGSIYKGRVTRVLPGMQSAFVDIGLERDAFLYVSDFMELEEHDEDLTDVVPTNRSSQDHRAPVAESTAADSHIQQRSSAEAGFENGAAEEADSSESVEASASAPSPQSSTGEPQERDRGWRGRRRRRGSRRDGRDRGLDSRPARSATESTSSAASTPARSTESGRSQSYGPPAGYQPILLPGESISKYRGRAAASQPPERYAQSENRETRADSAAGFAPSESLVPLMSAFPDDEPIFADSGSLIDTSHEQHETSWPAPSGYTEEQDHREVGRHEETRHKESVNAEASTSAAWNQNFLRSEPGGAAFAEARETEHAQDPEWGTETEKEEQELPALYNEPEHVAASIPETGVPAFAAPGTLEEETIEEDEADALRYEQSSDDGYEEFEEETRAAGHENGRGEISEIRETVAEIHMSSMAESGIVAGEPIAAESEEDSEELELEEAQAEAEAMLDAEARGNGTVDARAEVRAPANAGYTQRSPRPRPAYERRTGGRRGGRRFPRRQSQEVPKISDLLKEGQEVLVQIAKEPIGKKGARITSHIALPGRFLVYMPTVNHTGVSRKIASEEERQRLKRIVLSERENGHGGFIVRTAAQNASEDELRADIRFLKGLWNDIKTRAENSKPPALIYHDLNVVERVLRDQVTSDFSVIWVDTEPEYERILRFFNRFQPALVKRVKLYTKETPLFEQFGLAEEMNKALKSKVWLKSGGYIVINQTEALVAIDINTGKYVGKTTRLEDTIVKTNVDAIKEIVRQIRLRDLGGIIIIDFIDMDERRNRQRVMQALEEELRHDRAPSKVLQFNDFGLVAITRKRVKQSLERTIGAPCPYCQSTGYVKSLTTVANEIYVEMRKIAKHLEHEDVMLRVNPDVAKELKANNGRLLNEMEELTKRTIIVKSDPALHQEQFDIN